jgi:hypothetical protein
LFTTKILKSQLGKRSIKKIKVSEERAKNRNRKTKPGSLKYDENNIINYDHYNDFRIKEVLGVL